MAETCEGQEVRGVRAGAQAVPDVLGSATAVVERARLVRVSEAAVRAWVAERDARSLEAPATPVELQFAGDREACANFALLASCLNFCFWSDAPWAVEYRGRRWTRTYAMVAGLLRAIEADAGWLSAERWAAADEADVRAVFGGEGEIPLVVERRRVLNETGRILGERFGDSFARAVEACGADARWLAYLLAEEFPSFCDVATHAGQDVALLKRAQICAADLHRLWCDNGHDGLTGMDGLTVFADYRLPQYLRHVGIIEVDAELAARIERQEELAAGSAEEVELRCATVVAGELIRRGFDGAVPAWHIDFALWLHAHDPEVRVAHHRTRTVFY